MARADRHEQPRRLTAGFRELNAGTFVKTGAEGWVNTPGR